MKKNLVIISAVLLAVILVSGCVQTTQPSSSSTPNENETAPTENGAQTNGDTTPAGGETPPVPPGFDTPVIKEFTVEGFEFGYSPETLRASEGDTVKITVKNTGTMGHNLKVDEFNAATRIISPGTQETIEFVASQKGTFAFYCSVGNHRQLGMEGTLIVE